MIPALLTCVYVVYLYRTLNNVGATGSDVSDPSRRDVADLIQLTQRLNSLEKRLRAIADAAHQARSGS